MVYSLDFWLLKCAEMHQPDKKRYELFKKIATEGFEQNVKPMAKIEKHMTADLLTIINCLLHSRGTREIK